MPNNQGWISLYRKLKDNPLYSKPNYLVVWIDILLGVNHEKSTFIWNNKKITLFPGQGIFSQLKMSKKFKINIATVNRILKYLENEKQIEKQTTTKFTLVTVVNWSTYQQNEKQSEKQTKNKLKTTQKQAKTNNNDNNDNNDNNVNNENKREFLNKNDKKTLQGFINWFNKEYGKDFRVTEDYENLYVKALNNNVTIKDIIKAAKKISKSKHMRGENDEGLDYLTLKYVLNPTNVIEWINRSDKNGEDSKVEDDINNLF